MLASSLIKQELQESQVDYQLTNRFSDIISELNKIIFGPVCPTRYDITDQIPLWILFEKEERESYGYSGLNIFDFVQKYYDWLYCDSDGGAQYELSKKFLDIIDIDKTRITFLERFAKIYAPGFDASSLNINGGLVPEENLREFIKSIRTFFYHRKTTEDGIRYFFKKLYNISEENISIEIPKKFILRLNGGKFYDDESGIEFLNGLTGDYETLGSLSGSYLNGSRLQDGNWIQDWSYLLKVGLESQKYRQSYLDMAHPAGMRVVFEKTLEDYQGPTFDENNPFVCELPMLKNYAAYGISFDYSNTIAGITYTNTWIGQGITFIGLPSYLGCTLPTSEGYTGFTAATYLFPNWTDQTLITNFQQIYIGTMLQMCYFNELGSPNEQIPNCT